MLSDDIDDDDISRKLEFEIDNKLASKSKRKHLEDGFKKGKVVNEVLDKPTVMTLYKMIYLVLIMTVKSIELEIDMQYLKVKTLKTRT